MHEKTYYEVSLLATNYFKLLCGTVGPHLHSTYETLEEEEKPGKGRTYTIALSGREPYDIMQRVFSDQNG